MSQIADAPPPAARLSAKIASVHAWLIADHRASIIGARRYALLDVARAIGATLVVFLHCNGRVFPWAWGVMDLFFVLSGVLITRTLLLLDGRRHAIAEFFLFRVTRLAPAVVFFAVVYVAVVALFNHDGKASNIAPYMLLYQNLDLLFLGEKVFPRMREMEHMWSLVLEEHYYIFWGVISLAFVFRLKNAPVWVLTVPALLLIAALYFRYNGMHWWVLPARLDGFVIGSVMGLLLYSDKIRLPFGGRRNLWLGIAAFVLLLCFIRLGIGVYHSYADLKDYQFYRSAWLDVTCYSLASAALVYVLLAAEKHVTLDGPFMSWVQRVGQISYEVYLFHMPIIVALKSFNDFNFQYGTFVLFALALVLTLVCSELVSRFLTEPSLRGRKWIVARLNGAQPRVASSGSKEKSPA